MMAQVQLGITKETIEGLTLQEFELFLELLPECVTMKLKSELSHTYLIVTTFANAFRKKGSPAYKPEAMLKKIPDPQFDKIRESSEERTRNDGTILFISLVHYLSGAGKNERRAVNGSTGPEYPTV